MSRRFVAALVIASTLASLPACIPAWQGCQGDTGRDNCASAPRSEPSSSRDDHTGEIILIGVATVAILMVIVARHWSSSSPDAAKAPPIAATGRESSVAPVPPVADEGEQLRLQRMYAQGLVLARAGRCEGAQALGRQIARSSPDYVMTYSAEPLIIDCTRRTAPGGL